MAVMGCVGTLGVLFAVLIFRLDGHVEAELRPAQEEERWTSII